MKQLTACAPRRRDLNREPSEFRNNAPSTHSGAHTPTASGQAAFLHQEAAEAHLRPGLEPTQAALPAQPGTLPGSGPRTAVLLADKGPWHLCLTAQLSQMAAQWVCAHCPGYRGTDLQPRRRVSAGRLSGTRTPGRQHLKHSSPAGRAAPQMA